MANTLRFKRGIASGIPTGVAGEPLFTTDTFDLYIGNGTTNTRFQKYIASGATTQILRGDGSLYTFPLAISSPSNGQVLKYNGTSWVNDSDAGITGSGAAGQVAYFTGATTQAGSNNLFWDTTNSRLGVGTNSPLHLVDVAAAGNSALYIRAGATSLSRLIFGTSTNNNRGFVDYDNNTNSLIVRANENESFRVFGSTRNVGINTGATDSGQRLQVIGTSYFSDNTAIGNTTLIARTNLTVWKNITGDPTSFGVYSRGTIQSGVTTDASYYASVSETAAASFTLAALKHYRAVNAGFGAGSTVTNQYAFIAESSITGATNNYGFYGDIAAATGRWNLYMNGTAANYLNGELLLGSTSNTGEKLQVTGTMKVTGNTTIGGDLYLSAASKAIIFNSSTNLNTQIYESGGSLVLYTGANPRLTITSAGASTFNGTVTAGSFIPSSATAPTNGMYLPTTNTLGWSTNSTAQMRLDASGNLGLGVTPSAWASVNAFQLGYVGSLASRSGGSGVYLSSNVYFIGDPGANGANARYIQTTTAGSYAVIGNNHYWFTAPSGTLNTAITLTQAMTLDASGNLLVGGTSVYGATITSYSTSGRSGGIGIRNSAGTAAGGLFSYAAGSGSGSTDILVESVGFMQFNAAGAERMRLTTTNGNLHIGTFTADSGERLQVTGTARITGATSITNTMTARQVIVDGANNSNISRINLTRTDASWGVYNETDFRIYYSTGNTITPTTQYFSLGSGTGLATFSNAVTIGGNLTVDTNTLFVDATNNEVGIGTTSPNSTLHVSGSVTTAIVAKTANYTATVSDYTILCDTTGGGFTITLPAANTCTGRIYVIKKVIGNSGLNNVTIDGNGAETIDGAATLILQCKSSAMIQSDGANWYILALYSDASCL